MPVITMTWWGKYLQQPPQQQLKSQPYNTDTCNHYDHDKINTCNNHHNNNYNQNHIIQMPVITMTWWGKYLQQPPQQQLQSKPNDTDVCHHHDQD